MPRVQIVGAGECGLPLAHQLLRDNGTSVTLVTDRSAQAVLSGTVTSTQIKFPRTLDLETRAGLGMWDSTAPEIEGIRFAVALDRAVVAGWTGRLSRPARSVDQRTVFARRLTDFLTAGGDLEITDLSLPELDRRSADYDLTIVTRASTELAACFPTDPAWTVPNAPQRRLAVLYLDGVTPDPDNVGTYVSLPGIGEVIAYPALTGPPGQERCCEILLFEALPGGEIDVFNPHGTATERWQQAAQLLERYLPAALADRYRAAEVTDSGATLVGAVAPRMRQPVGTLPSGMPVLGGGDVVCRMDPGGAQGANNAVHCAFRYSEAIVGDPAGPYDRAWMEATAQPWLADIAHPAARWTMALLAPPPEMQALMVAAQDDPALADALADTFARPSDMSRFTAGSRVAQSEHLGGEQDSRAAAP
ncbi:styrene monooxygenase/indole monooxygenase family protein [Nocardia sp. NPDC057440]|uniref:styrene monooxygenase/indole monooxygenase family protein n=1 Tax=Nocardia sp. NPDC057440 TaxID=3346134 RepID=UPI003670EB24